ncbi:MAG TPA: glycosyltransferase family 39 protein [Dehalococcoidia bacterium]|nr:glycosyltransferase family 39 protein [Dehalococcoidia bacterium]
MAAPSFDFGGAKLLVGGRRVDEGPAEEVKHTHRGAPEALALLVIFLAFWLRVLALDQESLWFDTAHSGVVALNPTVGDVLRAVASDSQSPLYFLLLHFWLKLGQSDFWLRLLTALVGTGLVALAYATGRRLFTPGAGLWAALFSALTSYQIYYSRYPRAYILLAFFGLAAAYTMHWALHHGRRRAWVLHGLAVVAALYTHPYAFFLLPVLWGYAAWYCLRRDWSRFLPWAATASLACASYLPWVGVTLTQWGQVRAGADAWIEPVSGDSLKLLYDWLWFKTRAEYGLGLDLLLRGGRYLFSAVLLVALWQGRRRPELWLVAGLTLIPALLAFTFSALVTPLWDPRYLVFLSPFLALWLGGALACFTLPWKPLRSAGQPLALALLVVMSLPPLGSLYLDPAFRAPEIRSGSEWVRARYQQGDLILHINYQSYLPALWYDHQSTPGPYPEGGYSAPCVWDSLPDAWCTASPYREGYVNLELEDFARATDGERRVWLMVLYNHNWPGEDAKAQGLVERLRGQDFALGQSARFTGVLVYELRSSQAPR